MDGSGAWHERARYDPWVGRVVEAADIAPPAVSEVYSDGNGALFVVFSEPVTPPLSAIQSGTAIQSSVDSWSGAFDVRPVGQSPLAGNYALVDAPGYPTGTVVKFTPGSGFTANNTYEVVVKAGGLSDDWGNETAAATQPFTYAASATLGGGAPMGSTEPPPVTGPQFYNEVGFQAHLHDAEMGLILMRARVFDPPV